MNYCWFIITVVPPKTRLLLKRWKFQLKIWTNLEKFQNQDHKTINFRYRACACMYEILLVLSYHSPHPVSAPRYERYRVQQCSRLSAQMLEMSSHLKTLTSHNPNNYRLPSLFHITRRALEGIACSVHFPFFVHIILWLPSEINLDFFGIQPGTRYKIQISNLPGQLHIHKHVRFQ